MHDCSLIFKLPNKLNIKYLVKLKPEDITSALEPILEDIYHNKGHAIKTLIFCRTYNDCAAIFQALAYELSVNLQCLFSEQDGLSVCDIFSSATPPDKKDWIISQFTTKCSNLKVVICTSAFGLGMDAPDVYNVIHWGPPSTIEEYVQECGRCGRDGKNATALLYHTGTDFTGFKNVSSCIKSYCQNNDVCRRQGLMQVFDPSCIVTKPVPLHMCCDICSYTCDCIDCADIRALTESDLSLQLDLPVLPEMKQKQIMELVFQFRAQLCSSHNNAFLFGPEITTGITDTLVKKIASNAQHISNLDDLIHLGCPSTNASTIYHIIDNVKDSD